MSLFIFVLEVIGTIAFAVSGAMVAIEKSMDILGVIILGMTTAIGGGVIRDLILGLTPPQMFKNPIYAAISICISIVVFMIKYYDKDDSIGIGTVLYEKILLLFDAVGLGVFTVVGVNVAFNAAGRCSIFLSVFVGVLTGVGGGILRDVMAGNTPYVFVKHVYACASITGAVICTLLWNVSGKTFSMVIGMTSVFIIRILAAHYRWNLPKIDRACKM